MSSVTACIFTAEDIELQGVSPPVQLWHVLHCFTDLLWGWRRGPGRESHQSTWCQILSVWEHKSDTKDKWGESVRGNRDRPLTLTSWTLMFNSILYFYQTKCSGFDILVALKRLEKIFRLEFWRKIIDLHDVGEFVLCQINFVIVVPVHVVVVKFRILDWLLFSTLSHCQLEE